MTTRPTACPAAVWAEPTARFTPCKRGALSGSITNKER